MLSRLYRLPLRNLHRKSYRPFAGVAAISGGLLLAAGYVHADSLEGNETRQSLGSLIRSYTVYTMCSIPPLVDYSPKILGVLTTTPGVRHITEAIVRTTFFNHVRSLYLSAPYSRILTFRPCSLLAGIPRRAPYPFSVRSVEGTKVHSSLTR